MTAEFYSFPHPPTHPDGIVHIVGAGPGDPDLLTARALKLLLRADVAIYDRLVGPEIVALIPEGAERLYVGKAKSAHSAPQDGINALMALHARAGRRVVRLKGGDPFIFGRGGEEVDYLLGRGVRVDIVPGVTAATGCAAYAGIPLTHRDYAAAVTFISGHAKDGEPDLDWAGLARGRQTVVVYMGLSTAERVAARLIQHGMDPAMPVAVVENGTLPTQKVAVGAVGHLPDLIVRHEIAGPALIVIGDVAAQAIDYGAGRQSLATAL